MAKYFNLITVGTPTGLNASLQAGGSLPVNTTYYYRVIAIRLYGSYNLPILSGPTAEVSVTTDSSNRTAYISWNPVTGATGYVIQRTTTSGYYPVGGQNTFTVTSNRWCFTTLTNLTDDGTKLWTFNIDHSRDYPLTVVYSDNNDIIYQYEIYDYAVSAGWTHIVCPFPSGILNSISSDNKAALPLTFHGGLHIYACRFYWEGPIIIVNSCFMSATNTEFLQRTQSYAPSLMTYGIALPIYTTNNSSQAGTYTCSNYFAGTGKLNNFVTRHICPANQALGYYSLVYYANLETIPELYIANINHKTASTAINTTSQLTGLTVGDFSCRSGDTFGPSTVYGQILATANQWLKDVRAFPTGNAFDLFSSSQSQAFIDFYCPTPIESLTVFYYGPSGTNMTSSFMFTVNGVISDKNGNPISGAKVYITDSRGNSAVFENLNVTSSTSLNDTDTSSTFVVSNASNISVGDVLRIRGGTELLLVTNKSGNTLTVQRGYGGTPKRKSSSSFNQYVWKQLPYATTDANGRFSQICIHKEYYSISSSSRTDTITNLISGGHVGVVTHTPHSIRVEAPGYATYEDVITVDRPLNLEIALSPATGGGGGGSSSYVRRIYQR